MSDSIRVIIADDHLIVREGLRLIFETAPDIDLVGEAENGAQSLKLAANHTPDVILMDLRMPVMDGIQAIEQLHATHPQIAIVILTTFNEDELMLHGLRAGACAFLLKDTDRDTLLETIRAAATGKTLLGPDIMARLLNPPENPSSTPQAPALTEREYQVLQEAAQGKRSKEIALDLSISERTVKAHLTSIYNKFGVDSRAAAIAVAARRGLLHDLG